MRRQLEKTTKVKVPTLISRIAFDIVSHHQAPYEKIVAGSPLTLRSGQFKLEDLSPSVLATNLLSLEFFLTFQDVKNSYHQGFLSNLYEVFFYESWEGYGLFSVFFLRR